MLKGDWNTNRNWAIYGWPEIDSIWLVIHFYFELQCCRKGIALQQKNNWMYQQCLQVSRKHATFYVNLVSFKGASKYHQAMDDCSVPLAPRRLTPLLYGRPEVFHLILLFTPNPSSYFRIIWDLCKNLLAFLIRENRWDTSSWGVEPALEQKGMWGWSEKENVGMRQIVHSQEGQITLESTVNWMKGCRRRIHTESSMARPWVRGGTRDGDSCIHSRKVTYWEGGDQCSACTWELAGRSAYGQR